MSDLCFTKMQALGNDFVLLTTPEPLTSDQIRFLCDRRLGIGCDQLILLRDHPTADAEITFYNADGSIALACGNGTRCVAASLNKVEGEIQTPSGLFHFWRKGEEVTISLKSPPPPVKCAQGYQVDVGNPHHVIFVENLESVDLTALALSLQPPGGINVEVAQVVDSTTIKARVWERGVGITPACGSGACAVGFLALHLGLVEKAPLILEMEGGHLGVEWHEGGPLLLTGPAEFCFEGRIALP